jgi:hypothetical protein
VPRGQRDRSLRPYSRLSGPTVLVLLKEKRSSVCGPKFCRICTVTSTETAGRAIGHAGSDRLHSGSFGDVGFIVDKWLSGDRLCGLVVRVLGYRSGGPGSIPGTTRKKSTSWSGMGSTQPREYN